MTDQITVNESALPAALGSAARQIMLVVGGWAMGRGYLQNDTWTAILTVATIAAPAVYGQIKGWLRHNDMVAVVKIAPDSVAKVK